MASRRLSIVAGVAGVSAGLAPYLPTVVCPGGACTSCFACIGAGGAAASALIVAFITGKLRSRSDEHGGESTTNRQK
jgi:hypothetical protein